MEKFSFNNEKIEKVIKEGSKFGDCEIYIHQLNATTGNLHKNTITSVESTKKFSAGFRIFINKRQGYVLSSRIDEELVKKAVKIAKLSKEVDFYGLPEINKKVYKNVSEKILNFELENVKKFLQIFDDKVTLSEGAISYGVEANKIVNSNGVDCESEISFFGISGMCIADKGNKSTAIDRKEECFLFDIENFGKNLRKKAIESLNPKKMDDIPEVIIFSPEVFAEILSLFISNFDAYAVDKGESILAGKIGERIGNLSLTIIDDPLMHNGLNSTPFDDEGCPTKKNFLMEDGIVKNFAYDWTMAKKFNVEPTGNAVRIEANLPFIGFHNIIIDDKNKIKKIFDEYDKAIYVCSVSGMHTANPVTTEFSVNVERSFYIRNGNKNPLKNFILSGKFTDIKILGIDRSVENRGGIYVPNVACVGLKIVA